MSEPPDDGDVYSGPVRLDPVSEPVGWNVYDGSGGAWQLREFIPNEPVLSAAAEQFASEVEEEIRPKGGVIGPPYVHRLGATHGPAFTIQDEFPRWQPPLSRFGVPVAPFRPFPVKGKVQEVPEAFRRRKPQVP